MVSEHRPNPSHAPDYSPAADRNKEPILQVLRPAMPATGLVLEIASGTGQHIVHFARALPNLTWQPSDPDADRRQSIQHRIASEQLLNVQPPLDLDVLHVPWPIEQADALICINMIHIAPWAAAAALFEGASHLLSSDQLLFLYGPYRRFGQHTAPSNEAFDQDLRHRNPEWGLRDLEAVSDLGDRTGFELAEVVAMPSNNFSLVFRKRSRPV